jgi:hypothetical protein
MFDEKMTGRTSGFVGLHTGSLGIDVYPSAVGSGRKKKGPTENRRALVADRGDHSCKFVHLGKFKAVFIRLTTH